MEIQKFILTFEKKKKNTRSLKLEILFGLCYNFVYFYYKTASLKMTKMNHTISIGTSLL